MLSSVLRPGRLTVVAAFARSIYVRSAGADIICLCGEDLPMGPFTLTCRSWPLSVSTAVRPGDVWLLSGGAITVSRKTRIVLDAAVVWEPARWQGQHAAACERALTRLLEAEGRCFPVLNGLAVFPRDVLHAAGATKRPAPAGLRKNSGNGAAGDLTAQALAKAGREGLRALDEWLCTPPGQDFPAARQRILEGLLGLGPGLTPSGDDVLGGALLALHGLGLTEQAARLGESLLNVARERTNQISCAYLRAAAAGYGASVLHEAITALCADSPALFNTLRELGRLGHSSGWDAFLGAICVCGRARLLMGQRAV